ncbi:hypothetical protein [Stenotrophomonas sp.]|uniref:hypothetical protein n=1 Tax=Stenotrophomonas sp. TaxID=69392 RepID=UPI0028987257|nr:hypothetical protein [Stenotrophomonas sp.]
MAGDWIKMRSNLATSPKVVRIASALKADRLRVIGGLHAVWCLFDTHSDDGTLVGYSPVVLDDLIGWPGFSAAMIAVEWMLEDGENLVVPRFDDHNGASAKRRAQDADRKKNVRNMSAPASASEADKKRTREEKRREEEKSPPYPPADAGGADLLGGQAGRVTKAERIAQIAGDAQAAYNTILAKPNGALAACTVLNKPRVKSVEKALPTVRQLCTRMFGNERVTPDFWQAYFETVAEDDFLAGRQQGGPGHENWKPDFEYLLRESVIAKAVDRAMSEVTQ